MIDMATVIMILFLVGFGAWVWWSNLKDIEYYNKRIDYYRESRDRISDALNEANVRELADCEKIDQLTKERDELLEKLNKLSKILEDK